MICSAVRVHYCMDVCICYAIRFQQVEGSSSSSGRRGKPESTDDESVFEQMFHAVVTATDDQRPLSEMFKILPSRSVGARCILIESKCNILKKYCRVGIMQA